MAKPSGKMGVIEGVNGTVVNRRAIYLTFYTIASYRTMRGFDDHTLSLFDLI